MRQDARRTFQGAYQPNVTIVRASNGGKCSPPRNACSRSRWVRQRIEADQGFVDEPGMTHDEAAFRQSVEKLLHQRAEIGLPGKIIGAGEGRIEGDTGACGTAAKLRAQNIEKQRLGRAEPLP